MSVVQPGGGRQRGSGQRPGSAPPRSGGPAQRTARPQQTKGTPPGRSEPTGRAGTQKTGAGQKPGSPQKPGARPRPGAAPRPGADKSKGRRNVPVQAAPPRRFSPTVMAIGAIGVVVVVVVALVVIKLTGSSSPTTGNSSPAPEDVPAAASVVSAVTGVSDSVVQSVGLPSPGQGSFLTLPSVLKGQPPLTYDGKPGVLFIGAEFCPYCGAERWSMVMALSKFGTFSGLKQTTSSTWDAYPDTATFSFLGSSYQSNYLVFKPIETESNDTGPGGAGRHVITPLTSAQQKLWTTYDGKFGQQAGFPFLDIGNKVFAYSPSYTPQVLQGLDWTTIAGKLSNAKDPVTQGIVGTANYLTAALCSITSEQPASVCSSTLVSKAQKTLGLN
jgi:hypothetical protein